MLRVVFFPITYMIRGFWRNQFSRKMGDFGFRFPQAFLLHVMNFSLESLQFSTERKNYDIEIFNSEIVCFYVLNFDIFFRIGGKRGVLNEINI